MSFAEGKLAKELCDLFKAGGCASRQTKMRTARESVVGTGNWVIGKSDDAMKS